MMDKKWKGKTICEKGRQDRDREKGRENGGIGRRECFKAMEKNVIG
jgi:hypothetical protein